MKVALLTLLVASTQAVALKQKAATDLYANKGDFHIGAPDPYLEDDHRIILQSDPEDKRWTDYKSSMAGEATHQGIQSVNGITKNSKTHFEKGHKVLQIDNDLEEKEDIKDKDEEENKEDEKDEKDEKDEE